MASCGAQPPSPGVREKMIEMQADIWSGVTEGGGRARGGGSAHTSEGGITANCRRCIREPRAARPLPGQAPPLPYWPACEGAWRSRATPLPALAPLRVKERVAARPRPPSGDWSLPGPAPPARALASRRGVGGAWACAAEPPGPGRAGPLGGMRGARAGAAGRARPRPRRRLLLLLLPLVLGACAAPPAPCAAPCACRRGLLDCSRHRLPAPARRLPPLPAGTTAL